MNSTPTSTRRSAPSSKRARGSRWSAYKHDVDVYARRVIGDATAGEPILAGPLVRLACERHLRDRETGHRCGLHFDEAKADHAIGFFPKFLRFTDGLHAGEPFELQPWQVFIVGSCFGWLDADGTRRFRVAYIEVGKGNGKTPLAAGMGLYLLVADGEPAAQVFSAAVSAEQARILFADAERMVDSSPLLKRRIEASVNNLAVPETYSFFRPVSSEHRGLDGKRVHGALVDELHEHPTSLVVDKMRAGTKGRQQALIVEITNSGYDRASVCWQHHELSRHVLEQSVENDAWFAYVCSLDDGDDPLMDEACWPKANPNLGVSIAHKYLREQVNEAVGMPSKANIVLRLNFCVWTHAESRAIEMARWHSCKAEIPADELLGEACYAGLDLGQSDDLSALALIWPLNDGRVAVRMRFWLPQSALRKYPHRPYDHWRRAGVLDVTPGEMSDYDIVEAAVADECRRWGVQQCAYDRRFGHQLAQHLQGMGITMVDTAQGFQLNEPLKRFLELVAEGDLCHGNHPILTWMASNLVVRTGPQGEMRIDKEQAAEKIDGIAAIVMAMDRFIRQPPKPENVYLTRGVRTLGEAL
jgi:phage terminase large subunit-like protein